MVSHSLHTILVACFLATAALTHQTQINTTCSENSTRLHLSDPPYENYFYSDCHSSSHVVITSPLSTSNLRVIGPRLLIAWPAGNSGIVSFFNAENGQNGTLSIKLENSTSTGETLDPIYIPRRSHYTGSKDWDPIVGVSGYINFNSSAVLTVPILGSIRTIRDFTEGPSIVYPAVQEAVRFSQEEHGRVSLSRTWFDNVTTASLQFTPINGSNAVEMRNGANTTLLFGKGTYQFNASFNYPQLDQLSPQEVLNNASQSLIEQNPDPTISLSFLSYTDKLLAGTWRFLTYFGRDSMISLLLLQPILSAGPNSSIEAVLSAVLERVNRTDGSVCHEEVIGDYATWLNLQKHVSSTAPGCDYKMVDTDLLLPVVLRSYLVDTEVGRNRSEAFLNTTASFLVSNAGLTYAELAQFTAQKIMNITAAFAAPCGQTKENLIHLKDGEVVGQWRDSEVGIGGGRIPYDVNTAMVPAALRAIAALSRAGLFPEHTEWDETATRYADVWEDETLGFFEVRVEREEALELVRNYVNESSFPGPVNTSSITSDVRFYGLALDGTSNQSLVRIMNTDDCYRLFLLNPTNQSQLTSFLDQAAEHILQPFPIGLSNPVGLFIANPAYGGNPIYAKSFTREAYHGIVVWSWQLAMMAEGVARQLERCSEPEVPDFCTNTPLHTKVLSAYNHLWDLIDNNQAQLSSEVWSWKYQDEDFHVEPLGAFGATESDVRQLWSLTFLAVRRKQF
ncbi:glycogen debranching enzyme [Delitschia confertaspora ATCC 74209]|uniref:Glycogen debranching enzyme n=1 Tax=Delitschia confertaspora ATCC 74209 TaxID=1513339 RepID=A0A9P4JI19_9PLEO|nr:glycogen debranching enzyme [Delitschia confertaspora ATCC 74209]